MTFRKVKKKSDPAECNPVGSKRDFYDLTRGIHRIIPCLMVAVAILLGFFFILDFTGNNDSVLGRGLVWLFSGLFSSGMYALPLLLFWQGVRWRTDIAQRRAVGRAIYYLLFLIMFGAIRFCFSGERDLALSIPALFSAGQTLRGAGLFGGLIGFVLFKVTGYIGVPFVSAVLILLFCSHFLRLTPNTVLEKVRQRKEERQAAREKEAAHPTVTDIPLATPAQAAQESASADGEPLPRSVSDGEDLLSPQAKEELKHLHDSELQETEQARKHPMTRQEKKALKAMEKEAAKRKATEDAGYYPADAEESFEQIRRRLEREALEIERESIKTTPAPTPESSFDEPPAAAPGGMAEGVADASTVEVTAPPQDGALSADAVFGRFDPLAPGAVINATSTVLCPDLSSEEVRRESLHPLRRTRPENSGEKEAYQPVPGGVKGKGEGVGSFFIHAKHMDIPSTHNPRPMTPAPSEADPKEAAEEEPIGKPLSSFEELTKRADTEELVNPLPYVHPATQPSTQAQPVGQPAYASFTTPAQPTPQPSYQAPYAPTQNPYMPPYPPMNGYGQQPYMPPYGQGVPYGYPQQEIPYAAPNPYLQTGASYPFPPYGAAPQNQGMATSEAQRETSVPSGGGTGSPAGTPTTPGEPVAPQPSILATSHVADHPLRENVIIEEPSRASAPPSQASASDEGATAGRKTPTYENYLFPPLSLLNRSVPISNINSQAEIDETSARLVNEFRKFKFAIEVREVTIGPRITRYCISPPDGVRINTLIGLANDIALGLAVKSIRINPVPDTPYLGVEIPNRNPSTVRLSSLVDTEEFRHTKTVTTVPLGANITGSPVFADIAKMPHVLVAGATGMGKSVLINSILLSLLYKSKPNEVKLILVDPKRVEMSVYNGIPHLLIPPVVEPQKAAGALIWAVGEMERRYHLMETMGTRSIEGYNEAVKRDPSRGEPQPKIIIVIDELNDLMMQARDAVEPAIMSIAQKARAAGIHLIIGTQRPSVDVITGVIKANIPSRIALHVSSGTDSRTILDTYGAEKLLDKGDMLAVISGAEPIRVQSAFVSDEEVENVTSFLRQNAGPAVYDEIISAQIDSETEKYKNSGKRASDRGDDDEEMDGSIFEDSQFMQACNVALESGKISTSLLQRRCSIGYGKAAKYIDVMESMGIVSAPDGQKPRDVLMSRDQFMEMVSRENFSGD